METAAEASERYFHRMTVVCARCWGMPPFSVIDAGTAGRIALEDAIECWLEQDFLTGGAIDRWMRREHIADRIRRNKLIEGLAQKARYESDPERRAEIIRRMEDINHGR